MAGALFAVDIGRGGGLDWRLMGGSDPAKTIWLRLVEVFVIMSQ